MATGSLHMIFLPTAADPPRAALGEAEGGGQALGQHKEEWELVAAGCEAAT